VKSMQVAIAFAGGLLAVAGALTEERGQVTDGPRVVEGALETIPPPPAGPVEKPAVSVSMPAIELGPAITRTQIWKLPDGTIVEGPTLEDPGYNQWAKMYVHPLLKAGCKDGRCPLKPSPNSGKRTNRAR
jgi:hypothetical protein